MKSACYSSAILVVVMLCAGCGGYGAHKGPWKKAPMPANGNYDGVYQSDFGRMELTVSGEHVVGLFEDDLHYGRLEGVIDGNLLRFSWVQYGEEMRGKTRETSGTGVFQYIVDVVPTTSEKSKEFHRLEGWYGYDGAKMVNRWDGSKMSARVKKRLTQKKPGGLEDGENSEYESSRGFGERKTQEKAQSEPEPEPESESEPESEPEPKSGSTGSDDLF